MSAVASGTPELSSVPLATRLTAVAASGTTRLVIGAMLVVATYRTSLVTLLEVLQLDTPIAHLALVPLISVGLAWWARRSDPGPPISDRQVDWIVGLPLLAVAVAMNELLPGELSWEYWVWRIDLLSLPIFVAGLVTLLFGVRALWKYRVAIAFLFLAWPYPYQRVLDRWLGALTDLTISGVTTLMRWWPLAERVAGSDSQFEIVHRGTGDTVRMSIASACSGANGLVGFLLVGTALMLTVAGTRWRKWAWLAIGAVLVLAVNVGRIIIIFWSARRWGERVAVDGFHPVVGLVVFNVAILVMLALMRPFGLRFRRAPLDGAPEPGSTEPARSGGRLRLPGRPVGAYASVAAACIMVGISNGNLRDYDRVASSIGDPQLVAFDASRETPEGWDLELLRRVEGYERFFGDGSDWIRYQYRPVVNGTGELRATAPITVDVIESPSRAAFSNYGVEQCYAFHGYELGERGHVDLGDGVTGGFVTWTNFDNQLTWTSLYWHWPIRVGDETHYERITLIMQDVPNNLFKAPGLAPLTTADIAAAAADDPEATATRLDRQRAFMTEFARELVGERVTGDAA